MHSTHQFCKTRRSFLWYAARILAAVAASMAAFGLGRFALSAASRSPKREIPKQLMSSLEPGFPIHVSAAGAWLAKASGEQSLLILEDRCTHLGCRVTWDSERALFRCPCHGSEFAADGKALQGPATRPLVRMVVIEDGMDSVIVSSRVPG
jgi:Rieske Fe-S protein